MNIKTVLTALIILSVIYGFTKGKKPAEILKAALSGMPACFIVIKILAVIGIMTGLWRSSGTISFFIYYGVRLIKPELFILMAFLICSIISFGLGTSFGTAATAGVVLMAIGRSGGVNPLICAGAVISGIYFGDRGSPASSAAALLAAVTDTDVLTNMKNMHRSALVPYILSTAFYSLLSFANPVSSVSEELLIALNEESSLSVFCIIPAAIMMFLPLFRVKIIICMLLSSLSAFAVSITVQGFSIIQVLKFALLGYSPREILMTDILSGGGFISMSDVFLMLFLSSVLGSLIEYLGLTEKPKEIIARLADKTGVLPASMLLSLVISMVLCNQTICTIMEQTLTKDLYKDKYRQALDIANSGLLLAACIPWCIAISVPLATLGVGSGAMLFDILVYLIPLWALIRDYFERHRLDTNR